MKFTVEEKELIYNGNADEAMPILLTTNYKDSLFLRQKSIDIEPVINNTDLQYLLKRMRVTLDASGGVGIAAPQVGIARNIFLLYRFDKADTPVEAIINPEIISYSPDTVAFYGDGCLSIPQMWGVTERHKFLVVKYYDEYGEYMEEKIEGFLRPDDFTAVIFQHEYDHLQGILFVDRIHKNELYKTDD